MLEILTQYFGQIHWQETLRGHVAGILTSHRVLIVSADLDILSSGSTKIDKGLPAISFNMLCKYKAHPYNNSQMLSSCLCRIFFLPARTLTFQYYRSLLWVGPALLFSSSAAVCVLGWDNKVRTILSISMPNAGKLVSLS